MVVVAQGWAREMGRGSARATEMETAVEKMGEAVVETTAEGVWERAKAMERGRVAEGIFLTFGIILHRF